MSIKNFPSVFKPLTLALLCVGSLYSQTPGGVVPSTLFGMTIHDSGATWPTVTVGGLKAVPQATWVYEEPNAPVSGVHTYNWAHLDAYVAAAQAHSVPVFWSTVGIPCWAAANPATCTQTPAGGATNSEATGEVAAGHLADFDAFITALVTRYHGKIEMYELWNEPYNTAEYTGSIPHMVTLTQHYHDIVRSLEPAALIAAPSGDGFVASWFSTYYADGGTTDVDVVTIHGETGSTHPESIQGSLLTAMKTVWAAHSLGSKPIWDTEAEPGISQTNDQLAAFVAVHYLLHWSLGIVREYWYTWSFEDGSTAKLQGTLAATAYQQVHDWMIGATMTTCSLNGSSDIYNANYTCALTKGGVTSIAAWNSSGSGTYAPSLSAGYTTYIDLAGNSHPIVGNSVPLTNQPVLITAPSTPPTFQTFYVSSSGGSDGNPGTSTAQPWKSLAKASSASYRPDTHILLKGGDTWTGQSLTTPSSGTSGHQIVYGAYGTGAPVIDGLNSVSDLILITKDHITINGLGLQNARSGLVKFTGTTGTQLLNLVGKNSFRGYYGQLGTGAALVDHVRYTVDSGHSQGSNPVEIWSTAPVTLTNNYCDIRPAGATGGTCYLLVGSSNALIQYNTAFGGTQGLGVKPTKITPSDKGCTGGAAVTGVRILDNHIEGISGAVGDGEGIELEGCPPEGGSTNQINTTVARNVIICKPGGAHVGTTDAIGGYYANGGKVYGNVIIGDCGYYANGTPGKTPSTTPRMLSFSSHSINMSIYNNTIVGVGRTSPSPVAGIALINNSGGLVKNNIFKNMPLAIYKDTGSVTEDYNIFDTDVGAVNGGGGSVTHGGHSLTGTHPGFVSGSPVSANDVKLAPGAAAIGAGLTLGTPYDVILGMAGTSSPYPQFTQTAPYALGAFGFGAGTGGGPPGAPTILSFTASPTSVAPGSGTTLTWVTTDATSLSIDDGFGTVIAVSGDSSSLSVFPSVTTTYTLTTTNPNGSAAASATVTVNIPVAPVIESFTATPSSVPSDHYSVLEWVVDGASTITLDPGNIDVTAFNMWQVRLRSTTTFTLTARNPVGPTTATVAVNVFTPVGPAAENIRYHQIRQYDRRGDAHEIQMFRGWPEPKPNYPSLYDEKGNVYPAQPRGADSSVVQMADSTGDYTPGNALVFDAKGRAMDGGTPPGSSANGCNTWLEQIPTGTLDGINATFNLDFQPSNPNIIFTLNGVVENPHLAFSLSGTTITMSYPPKATDKLDAWYFGCTEIAGGTPPPPTSTCTAPASAGTHLYWRAHLSEVNGGPALGGASAAEMGMHSTLGGSNIAIGGEGIAGSVYGTDGPGNAFDSNPSTIWGTAGEPDGDWLGYHFTSPVGIVEFTWTSRSDSLWYQQNPTAGTFDYSDDGSVWTELGTFTAPENHTPGEWTAGETKTISICAP